jgi:hypothetical protein
VIKPKFEIGDGYKTRDGRDAGIYWIGDGVIHGWVINRPGEQRWCYDWRSNGRGLTHSESGLDIMPKPEPLREMSEQINSWPDRIQLLLNGIRANLIFGTPENEIFEIVTELENEIRKTVESLKNDQTKI